MPVNNASATVGDALDAAYQAWADKPGARVMKLMAGKAADMLGRDLLLASLEPSHGARLLSSLRGSGLSAQSVRSYYAAIRRALAMAQAPVGDWPRPAQSKWQAPKVLPTNLDGAITALEARDWATTADLVRLLRGAGLAVRAEAMAGGFKVKKAQAFDRLEVSPGGANAPRAVAVVEPQARALVADPQRLAAIQSQGYSTHVYRWRSVAAAVGLGGTTLQDVAGGYAADLLSRTGGTWPLKAEED